MGSLFLTNYVLAPEDKQKKRQLFYRVVDAMLKRHIMPELDIVYIDKYVQSLMEQTEYTNVYVQDDGVEAVFCSAFFTDSDPHLHGRGLYLALLLGSGDNPELAPKLVRSLIRFAKNNQCDWIAIHHRTAPLTYRCQYKKLRS